MFYYIIFTFLYSKNELSQAKHSSFFICFKNYDLEHSYRKVKKTHLHGLFKE